MSLSLDGHILGHTDAGTAISASLTTSNSNDVIVVTVISNVAVSSVTASGLTFTEVSGLPFSVGGNFVDFWWAPASLPLGSLSITVNTSTSTYITMIAFGISGANILTPFDGAVVTNNGSDVTISTTAANTFIFGTAVDNSVTPSGGFTEIETQTLFNLTEYEIFSSPQTSLTVGTGSSGKAWAAVAVVAGASTPTSNFSPMPMKLILLKMDDQ